MEPFLTATVRELEKPRPLLKQVVDHVGSRYSVGRDEMGGFLESRLAELEEVEIDLILSPQFTPTLEDQAAFSDLLETATLPAAQWPALIAALAARPVFAPLVTEDGATHRVKLHEVTLERFVTRLNLDARVPERIDKVINSLAPEPARTLLKAIARRAIFAAAERSEILFQYLVRSTSDSFFDPEDAVALLRLMETYQPASVPDVLDRIPHWLQVLDQEIKSAAQPKPFFAARVQELHGGGRDQRRHDNPLAERKQAEFRFLNLLQSVLTE